MPFKIRVIMRWPLPTRRDHDPRIMIAGEMDSCAMIAGKMDRLRHDRGKDGERHHDHGDLGEAGRRRRPPSWRRGRAPVPVVAAYGFGERRDQASAGPAFAAMDGSSAEHELR
jgi:hypothetical protein